MIVQIHFRQGRNGVNRGFNKLQLLNYPPTAVSSIHLNSTEITTEAAGLDLGLDLSADGPPAAKQQSPPYLKTKKEQRRTKGQQGLMDRKSVEGVVLVERRADQGEAEDGMLG